MKKIEILIVAISVFSGNVAFAEIDAGCEQLWNGTSAARTCQLLNLTKYQAGGAAFCTIEAICRAPGTHPDYPVQGNLNTIERNNTVHNKESVSTSTILQGGLNNCNGKLTYKPC